MRRQQRPGSPPNQMIPSAVKLLRQEGRETLLRLLGAFVCWLTAIVLFGCILVSSQSHMGIHTAYLLACLLCIVCGIVLLPNARSQALTMLREQPDVRAVGPLLDALDISPPARTTAIRGLLTTLLPRMQSEDVWLLSERQRRKLYAALMLGDAAGDLPYLLAILQALQHVGDVETLRRLNYLIQLGAVTDAQRRLLYAAQNCANALENRLQHTQTYATLLRPAASAAPTDELLHPAYPHADAQPATSCAPRRMKMRRPPRNLAISDKQHDVKNASLVSAQCLPEP